MKKNFCKVIALLFVVTMMMTTVAFADAAIGTPAVAEQVVTVTLSGLVGGEEATILVVNKGVALTAVQDADIVYINQDTIADNGTVEFELDASNAAGDATTGKYVDIYCGYTSISSADANEDGIADAILAAKNVQIVAAAPVGPDVNTTEGATKTGVKTNSFGNTSTAKGYTRVFVELATPADAANWNPTHSSADSEIYYSADRKGYDCLLKTEETTIAAILEELTWNSGAPVNTIKYGDTDGNNRISAVDLGVAKKAIKRQEVSRKNLLTVDVDGNGRISATDLGEMKKVTKRIMTINDFSILGQ